MTNSESPLNDADQSKRITRRSMLGLLAGAGVVVGGFTARRVFADTHRAPPDAMQTASSPTTDDSCAGLKAYAGAMQAAYDDAANVDPQLKDKSLSAASPDADLSAYARAFSVLVGEMQRIAPPVYAQAYHAAALDYLTLYETMLNEAVSKHENFLYALAAHGTEVDKKKSALKHGKAVAVAGCPTFATAFPKDVPGS